MTATTARQDRGDAASPPVDEIRRCLARLQAARALKASPQRRRLLEYVVEQTLAGRADRLKAFELAVAVLGRDERFDPQSDPIVRVEMGRLRRELEHYYAADGRDDAVRIDIPKGGYAPTFTPSADARSPPEPTTPANAASPAPMTARLLVWSGALLGIAVTALLAAWAVRESSAPPPAVAVSGDRLGRPALGVGRFSSSGEDAGHAYLADGIRGEIVTALLRFKEIVVYDEPAGAPEQAGFVLGGTVRRDGSRIRITAQLVDGRSGAGIWGQSYEDDLSIGSLFEIQTAIASKVAGAIAAPYGIIAIARDAAASERPAALSSYDCMLRAHAYRRRADRALHGPVRDCLEAAIAREPGYGEARAMLALAYLDEYRFGFDPRPDRYDARDRALETARAAAELAPDSALAQLALFDVQFFRGKLGPAFAAGERAVVLNPNYPDTLAKLGMRLAHAGQWQRGIGLVRQAMALSPSPPGWYFIPLATNELRHGHDAQALAYAEQVNMPDFFWSHAVLAAIYGRLGRTEDARAAVRRLLAVRPGFLAHAADELARQQFDPDLTDILVAGLRKAGLDL